MSTKDAFTAFSVVHEGSLPAVTRLSRMLLGLGQEAADAAPGGFESTTHILQALAAAAACDDATLVSKLAMQLHAFMHGSGPDACDSMLQISAVPSRDATSTSILMTQMDDGFILAVHELIACIASHCGLGGACLPGAILALAAAAQLEAAAAIMVADALRQTPQARSQLAAAVSTKAPPMLLHATVLLLSQLPPPATASQGGAPAELLQTAMDTACTHMAAELRSTQAEVQRGLAVAHCSAAWQQGVQGGVQPSQQVAQQLQLLVGAALVDIVCEGNSPASPPVAWAVTPGLCLVLGGEGGALASAPPVACWPLALAWGRDSSFRQGLVAVDTGALQRCMGALAAAPAAAAGGGGGAGACSTHTVAEFLRRARNGLHEQTSSSVPHAGTCAELAACQQLLQSALEELAAEKRRCALQAAAASTANRRLMDAHAADQLAWAAQRHEQEKRAVCLQGDVAVLKSVLGSERQSHAVCRQRFAAERMAAVAAIRATSAAQHAAAQQQQRADAAEARCGDLTAQVCKLTRRLGGAKAAARASKAQFAGHVAQLKADVAAKLSALEALEAQAWQEGAWSQSQGSQDGVCAGEASPCKRTPTPGKHRIVTDTPSSGGKSVRFNLQGQAATPGTVRRMLQESESEDLLLRGRGVQGGAASPAGGGIYASEWLHDGHDGALSPCLFGNDSQPPEALGTGSQPLQSPEHLDGGGVASRGVLDASFARHRGNTLFGAGVYKRERVAVSPCVTPGAAAAATEGDCSSISTPSTAVPGRHDSTSGRLHPRQRRRGEAARHAPPPRQPFAELHMSPGGEKARRNLRRSSRGHVRTAGGLLLESVQ